MFTACSESSSSSQLGFKRASWVFSEHFSVCCYFTSHSTRYWRLGGRSIILLDTDDGVTRNSWRNRLNTVKCGRHSKRWLAVVKCPGIVINLGNMKRRCLQAIWRLYCPSSTSFSCEIMVSDALFAFYWLLIINLGFCALDNRFRPIWRGLISWRC